MKKQQGFTLLEVLIAVLIFAIGLLGLASLQTFGQRNNHSAYLRSQAIIQAYDMADRIRVNRNAAPSYVGKTVDSAPCDIEADTCNTPELVAQYDLYEWQKVTKQLLPDAQTAVTRPGNYLVTVSWTDNANEPEKPTSTFALEFRP